MALEAGVDLIHFTCDWKDVESIDGVNRYIATLRDLHGYLVERSKRVTGTVNYRDNTGQEQAVRLATMFVRST